MEGAEQSGVSGEDPQCPDDTFKDQIDTAPKEDREKGKRRRGICAAFRWTWITIATAGSMALNLISLVLVFVTKPFGSFQPSDGGAGRIITAISSGITCAATGPAVIICEHRLKANANLRDNINAIREEANRFAQENIKLSLNIDQLEEDVARLEDIESALSALAEEQGESLEQLMILVKENKRINKKMKKNMAGEQMQQVLQIVMEADKNEDFSFDDEELEVLIFRLKHLESVKENFDEEKFRKSYNGQNRSMGALIGLARELIPEEELEDDSDDSSEFDDSTSV